MLYKLYSVGKQLRYFAHSDWLKTYSSLQCNWYLRHSNMRILWWKQREEKPWSLHEKTCYFTYNSPLILHRSLCSEKEKTHVKRSLIFIQEFKTFSLINKHDGLQWRWVPCNDKFSFYNLGRKGLRIFKNKGYFTHYALNVAL